MPNLCFGLLADTHYARRPPQGNRYYENSLEKTYAYQEHFSKHPLDFVVHLGDLIDQPSPVDTFEGLLAAKEVKKACQSFGVPVHYVLGNHDVDSALREDLLALLFPGDSPGYYAFDAGGYRCLVLDTNARPDGTPYTPGRSDWENLYVAPPQVEWLSQELSSAGDTPVLVFSHGLIDDTTERYGVRNAKEIRTLLERSSVVGVFSGHLHGGRTSGIRGIPYFAVPATVESPSDSICWVVQAKGERFRIHCFTSKQCSQKLWIP